MLLCWMPYVSIAIVLRVNGKSILRRFRRIAKSDYWRRHDRLSFLPSGTTRLLMKGFSLCVWVFFKSLPTILKFYWILRRITGNFMIVCPCIVTDSLWIKPTDAPNSNFIGITALNVSGRLSAHHQEFLTVHRLWYILCSCDELYQE